MSRPLRLGYLFAGLIVAILIGGLLLPLIGRPSKIGANTRNSMNGKQLGIACRLFAEDHDGRFPVHLSELQPDYVREENFKSLAYRVVDAAGRPTNETLDWLYYGAGFDDTSITTVLIASPQVVISKGKPYRVSIQADSSGYTMPESEYQARLTETIRRMPAPHRKPPPQTSPPGKTAPF